MGLTAYASVREWIHSHAESAIVLPQNVRPERDTSVVLIDATQKMRKSPPRLTGDEFCRWFWSFLDSLPSMYVVVTMDKTSFVPSEKATTQEARVEDESYSKNSVFGPLGVRHSSSTAWRTFSGMEAVSCRAARGALMHWLHQWAVRNHPTRGRDQQVVLEFEYPVGQPAAVQVGPGDLIGSLDDEFAPPVGEADVAQLAWVNAFRTIDVVSLQIDSDLLCIALLYLLRTPESLHPQKWTWVAGLTPWLNEPLLATEEGFGEFRVVNPTPLAMQIGNGRKGRDRTPAQPRFCVDLLELYRRVRRASLAFPQIPDPDERVRCWVMMCVLQGTDYYTSKDRVSHRFGFDIIADALQRCWVQHWKSLWGWWDSMAVWSFDRMTDDQKKESDMVAFIAPEAFRVLVRWQLQLLWWQKTDDKDNEAREPELLSRLLFRFEEGKRSLTQYRLPSDDDLVHAHHQAWFNCAYWSRPFL